MCIWFKLFFDKISRSYTCCFHKNNEESSLFLDKWILWYRIWHVKGRICLTVIWWQWVRRELATQTCDVCWIYMPDFYLNNKHNKPAVQAQTLPNAPPLIGKVNCFSKITVTFELLMRVWCSSRFRNLFITMT